MSTIRKRWTQDELLVVLNIYHKLNFGQFHQRQPVVVALARKLGRTPGSVAMKLSNFASFDPVLRLRGIKGLGGAGRLDKDVWDEFYHDFEKSIVDSEEALRELFSVTDDKEIEVSRSNGIISSSLSMPVDRTETRAQVRQRRGQNLFRDAVLNNYDECCGVTQLNIRSLLVASHILPWAMYPGKRLEVKNGICLSRLHDTAFDNGLISFDDELRMLISTKLKSALPKKYIEGNFFVYENMPLCLPVNAIAPSQEYLSLHRKNIFIT